MKRIANVDTWMKNKVIKSVNHQSTNVHWFYFQDGTAAIVEFYQVGGGLIELVWSELAPIEPTHRWLTVFGNNHYYGPFDSELEAENYGKESKCGPYAVVQIKMP